MLSLNTQFHTTFTTEKDENPSDPSDLWRQSDIIQKKFKVGFPNPNKGTWLFQLSTNKSAFILSKVLEYLVISEMMFLREKKEQQSAMVVIATKTHACIIDFNKVFNIFDF